MSSGKKRGKKVYPKPPAPVDDLAHWDCCAYCGSPVDPDAPPFTISGATRRFPVCGEDCRRAGQRYIQADRRYKRVLYLVLAVCAILVLGATLFSAGPLVMCLPILPAGVAFLLFPYPISTFETFQSCPIRRVTLLCRILGAVLIVLFAVFAAASLG